MPLRTAAAAGALLLVVAVAAQDEPAATRPAEPPRPVKLLTLSAEASLAERRFFGRVVARQSVDLAFQVPGQLVEFPVAEGQRVAAGGLVARLDLADFERAVARAGLQLEQRQRELARLRQMGSAAVARATVDEAETALGLAELALSEARDDLRDATLPAPFAALVSARLVANYTTVAAGTPIVRLHDMSEIRVEIDVPEVLFSQRGQRDLREIVALFEGDPREHALAIREYNAEAAAVGQTYRVTLGMPPPADSQILPGQSATVIARFGVPDAQRLRVPVTALIYAPDRSVSVLAFEPLADDPDLGTLRKVPVVPDALIGDHVVLADGPPPGTEVVVAGASRVRPGMTVRRFDRAELK